MNPEANIYIASHHGLVGSALYATRKPMAIIMNNSYLDAPGANQR